MENEEEEKVCTYKCLCLEPNCKKCEVDKQRILDHINKYHRKLIQYKDEEKIRVHIKKPNNKDEWTVYTTSDEFIPVEEFFKNRGVIILNKDSDFVEDFIPPS